jgi:hypothetical protein
VLVDKFPDGIGAAVVADNHFVIPGAETLFPGTKTKQAVSQSRSALEGRDNEADFRLLRQDVSGAAETFLLKFALTRRGGGTRK